MRLKNILMTLFSVMVALLFVRCADDGGVTAIDSELKISATYLEATKAGGDESIEIFSNTDWSIQEAEAAEWLDLSATSGSESAEVTISVHANKTTFDREVTLVVTSGETNESILVKQLAGDESMSFSPESGVVLTKEAITTSINVTSNAAWDATVDQSWIDLADQTAQGDGVMTLTVEANPTVGEREATITFLTASGDKIPYKVTQTVGSATLILGDMEMLESYDESNKSLSVESNTSWSVDQTSSWVAVNRSHEMYTGNGDATIKIYAMEVNPKATERTETLTFHYGTETKTYEVTQKGSPSEIAVAQLTTQYVAAAGDYIDFDVTSNDTWEVVIEDSWLSVESQSEDTFKLKVDPYTTGATREAKVYARCVTTPATEVEITISQSSEAEEDTLKVASLTESCAKTETQFSVVVTSTGNWKMSSDSSWVTGAPTAEQSGDQTIQLTAVANDTVVERVAKITVESADGLVKQIVTVTQAAGDPTFSYECIVKSSDPKQTVDIANIDSAGIDIEISVTSNTSWSVAEVSSDWMSAGWGTFTGDGFFDVEIDENSSLSPREQTISVTVDGMSTVQEIKLTQLSADKSVSADAQNFEGVGGERSVAVTSNTNWEAAIVAISDGSDWLSITDGATGVENSSITIKVNEWNKYSDSETRTAYINFTISGESSPSKQVLVTQKAYPVETPVYEFSYVDANTLNLVVTNTKFTSSQTFSPTDFTLGYDNEYNGTKSGTVAISSITLDAEDDSKVVISTTDAVYNTDKLTLTTTADISLVNTAKLQLSEVIEPWYLEYLNNDFESEQASEGWSAVITSNDTAVNGTLLPIQDMCVDNPDATQSVNNSSKVMYADGGLVNTYSILSAPFANVEGNDAMLTFSVDIYLPSSSNIAGDMASTGFGPSFNTVESGILKGKTTKWMDTAGVNYDATWSSHYGWIGFSKFNETDKWYRVEIVYSASDNFATLFDDLRLTFTSNGYMDEVYLDNIVFGNAEERQ